MAIGRASGSGGAVDTGDGTAVSMKSLAQKIAQLQYGGHKAEAAEYLKKYGGQIDPAYLKAAGVQMPKGKSLFGQIKQKAASVASPVFNVLGRPAQVVQASLRTVGVAAAKGIHEATGIGHEVDTKNAGFGAIGKAFAGHGELTPWSMVGSQYSGTADALRQNGAPSSGIAGFGVTLAGGVADLAASAAYDPLSYTGGGVGGMTKSAEAGFGILRGSEGLGETAVQAIRRGGVKSLGAGEWETAQAAIRGSEKVQNMAKFARRAPEGEAALAASAAAKAEKIITEIERGGQKGLRLGGKTIVPYGEAAPLKAIGKAIGSARPGSAASLARSASRASDAFREKYGEVLYQAKHESELTLQGAKSRGALDLALRGKELEKAALKDFPQAERDAIAAALDTGTMDAVRPTLSKEGQELMSGLEDLRAEGYASLGEGYEVDQAIVQTSRTNEDLGQIHQSKFAEVSARLTEEARAPIAKAQETATALRSKADEAAAKLAEGQTKFAAREAEVGFGRAGRQASDNVAVLRERARVAGSAAAKAEAKVASAEAKAASRLLPELAPGGSGLSKVEQLAQRSANVARNKAARAGSFLKKEGEYLPRNVFTHSGARALRKLSKTMPEAEFTKLTGDLSDITRQGSTISRTGDDVLADTNAEWLKTFDAKGIKIKGNALEMDPTRLVAVSGRRGLDAVEEIKHISRLSKLQDARGNPLIISGEDGAKRAAAAGYKRVPGTKFVGDIYADPVMIKELTKLDHVIQNDDTLRQIGVLMKDINGLWAQNATTFNAAKRYIGDIFNNALDGVTDPGVYRLGAKMQSADKAVQKEIGRAAGPEWEAAIIEKLGKTDGELYIWATKDGVISSGLLSGDVQNRFADLVKGENSKWTGQRGTGIIKRASRNKIMDVGARTSRFEEDNVRLANYIHNMRKTGDRSIATQHVQQFLFDYSELSPTEVALKNVSRFYTYMRKNTPLQVKMMLDQPGIYSFAGKAHGALSSLAPGSAGQGLSPDYTVNRGDIPFFGNMIQTDSPLADAFSKLDPLVQTVAMIPGIGKMLPKEVHPEGGSAEVLRGFLGMASGGTVSIATAAVEQMTGTSLFTGAPLSKNDKNLAFKFVKVLLPELSKLGPITNPKGGNVPMQMLGKLLGLGVLPVNEKSMNREVTRRLHVAEDIIDKAKQNGEILPAQQDLIDAGLAPDTKTAKKILAAAGINTTVTKPKRTDAQKRADAMAKISA